MEEGWGRGTSGIHSGKSFNRGKKVGIGETLNLREEVKTSNEVVVDRREGDNPKGNV